MPPPTGPESPGKRETSIPSHDSSGANSTLQNDFAAQPRRRLTGSFATLVYWAVAVFFLSMWSARIARHFTLKPLAFFAVACGLCLAYGRLFLRLAPASIRERAGLSIQFLSGYLVANTFLFVLTLVASLGIRVDTAIVAACGALTLFVCRKPSPVRSRDGLPDLLCLVLCATATTLWCADALNPFVKDGQNTVFHLWQDSFFHAREISIFAQARGLATICDMRMAGVQAPVYHYASYAMPAAVASVTGTGAYEVFAGFQLPLGLLLSGLAAFGLASIIWGEWPGLAAAATLLLVRDGYEQGFANKFLSYNFMQQVGAAGLYGVACAALAWMCILLGCASGEWSAILFGYGIALAIAGYKAHIFVANAFLVMIYPCLFFKPLAGKWRLAAGVIFTAAFFCATTLSQHLKAVPTLRLDGSSIHDYASLIAFSYDPGPFKSFFRHALTSSEAPHPTRDIMLAAAILLSTFGLWLIGCPLAVSLARKKTDTAVLFLPLFVVANYLVMSLGLAMDRKNIANPEELLHRPFVWAYFIVAVWTGGAAYAGLNGNRPPGTRFERYLVCALVLAGLAVPVEFGPNLQTMPAWAGGLSSYTAMNSVPTPLVKACRYLRAHARPWDIIQDSENDPRLIVTGLAERQDFASAPPNSTTPLPEEMTRRLGDLAAFKAMTDTATIEAFARKNQISWYLLDPASKPAWPDSFLQAPAFQYGEYRVYHFNQ